MFQNKLHSMFLSSVLYELQMRNNYDMKCKQSVYILVLESIVMPVTINSNLILISVQLILYLFLLKILKIKVLKIRKINWIEIKVNLY